MILDAGQNYPRLRHRYDVCVVGGGPAGIALARRLGAAGRSVLLLESGGTRETERGRDLNRGSAHPPGSHEPLEENRRRQWGGTSAVWGGRCIPYDALDLQKRPWVPGSGWPIDPTELHTYYPEATVLCEAGGMDFDARSALPDSPKMLPGLDDDAIVTHPLERWSPPTHFGQRYSADLDRLRTVTVLLDATCSHVQLTPDGDSVDHLRVTNLAGHTRAIRARTYVLAAGGMENARLLLSSDDVAADGIGNQADNVGRYYQTHLFGCVAELELAPDAPPAHVGFDRDADGVYCRRRIWITPEAQAEHRLLNTVFFAARPPAGASGHRGALFSAVYLLKTLRSVIRQPRRARTLLRHERAVLLEHARAFLRQAPQALAELARQARARYLQERRLPSILPEDGLPSYFLQFQAEQTPNRNARLRLGEERDALGMRRLVVESQVTDADIESVLAAHRLLDARLRATRLGRLRYEEQDLEHALREFAANVNSHAHHIGTTRMSQDPQDGVVDSDCRVHGVANLYLAGGSVLPTSSHANPTLTIVALALRLADHLTARTEDVDVGAGAGAGARLVGERLHARQYAAARLRGDRLP